MPSHTVDMYNLLNKTFYKQYFRLRVLNSIRNICSTCQITVQWRINILRCKVRDLQIQTVIVT